VLQRMGRFDEAEDAFKQSYDLLVEMDELRGQAMVLNSLGGVLQRMGRFDEAEDAFKRSISIGEELKDKMHLAKVRTAFGRTLLSRREIAPALVELCAAFEIEENLRSVRGMEIVTQPLTQALDMSGNRDEALRYCERALDVAPRSSRLRALRDQISGKPRSIAKLKSGSVNAIKREMHQPIYGFILPDDQTDTVFFHRSKVEPDDLTQLKEGCRVEFAAEQGPKGPRARYVKLIY
jgi:cold shock CspA family protein